VITNEDILNELKLIRRDIKSTAYVCCLVITLLVLVAMACLSS